MGVCNKCPGMTPFETILPLQQQEWQRPHRPKDNRPGTLPRKDNAGGRVTEGRRGGERCGSLPGAVVPFGHVEFSMPLYNAVDEAKKTAHAAALGGDDVREQS